MQYWLYFTALRVNQPLWYRIVVWTSALACVLAVLGLVLAVIQFRRTKPFRNSIPYAGWMRWHYITGAIFGVFTLTWAFSGLLSMEPFAWTNATGLEIDRDVFTGGPVDLSLHSLDFPFWYDRRPLWDIGMITLSLGGSSVSAIGLLLGIRRVRRGSSRLVHAALPQQHGDASYPAPAGSSGAAPVEARFRTPASRQTASPADLSR